MRLCYLSNKEEPKVRQLQRCMFNSFGVFHLRVEYFMDVKAIWKAFFRKFKTVPEL